MKHLALVNQIFAQSRYLFHGLRVAIEFLHRDKQLSGCRRGILDNLAFEGALPVPELARRRKVSRQFIQTTINELLEQGWVEPITNPLHRRSSLFALTDTGHSVFQQIKAREAAFLTELPMPDVSPQDLEITLATLQKLTRTLHAALPEGTTQNEAETVEDQTHAVA